MKIRNLMTADVETCGAEDNLADAAMLMWRRDCGVAPVVGDDRRPVGVVTDRDICMATTLQNKPPTAIRVHEIMSSEISFVKPEDDIDHALKVMSSKQIRRLLVLDSE